MGNSHSCPKHVSGRLVKSQNHESDSNLQRFLNRTTVARKLAWFVSSKSFVPPFLILMILCPVLLWWTLVFFPIYWTRDISRGDDSFVYQVSSYNHLFTFCFRMQCMTQPVTRQYYRCSNILACSAETAQQWPAARELRTQSCPQIFSLPCERLGQLAGSSGDATFIHVESCSDGRAGGGWRGEKGNLFISNTALKLSKYLVTWTFLEPIILPKLYFSEQSDLQILSFANLTTQSFPAILSSFLNLWSVPYLSASWNVD